MLYVECKSPDPANCLYHVEHLNEDELTELADSSIAKMDFPKYAKALDALAELQEDLRIEEEMTADFVLTFPTDDEDADESEDYDLPLMRTIRLSHVGENFPLEVDLHLPEDETPFAWKSDILR